MASKVEALVRSFLKTDGDALCLVLGQRMFLKRGTASSVVGREALSQESFRAIADELAPGDLLESLVETGHKVPFRLDDVSEPVQIEFSGAADAPVMTIVRTRTAASRTATPAAAPAPMPSPSPAPAVTASRPATPAPSPAPSRAAAAARSSGRAIDRILLQMLECEASDVHLSSDNLPMFRIHGEMIGREDLGVMTSEAVASLMDPIFPARNRAEFGERCDTDFAYEIEGVARFRVNVFRDRKGVGVVLRQIPINILTAAQLNLPPAVVQLGDLSKGLVLVTGPTGSGKSTTLAAIINHINETRTDHIITIEDPIEFVHPNKKCLVNQREVGSHTMSFKEALRAALREDPDIVLVGEMRDLETIAIAIETAETGHLVFGTLHTTTAASTVDRIVDQFPTDRQAQIRVMLADSLRGVVSQTLLKKKGGGRVAAIEILLSNNAVANLIRDGKTFQLMSIMQTSKAQGMVLLNDALIDLVKRSVVEPREAYLKAVDKPALLAAFKTMNIPGIAELTRETAGPTASAREPAPAGVGS
jgi:twitching motility protein PilT